MQLFVSFYRATKRHSNNSNNNVIDKVTAKLRRSLSINSSLKENLFPSTSSDELQSSSKVYTYYGCLELFRDFAPFSFGHSLSFSILLLIENTCANNDN